MSTDPHEPVDAGANAAPKPASPAPPPVSATKIVLGFIAVISVACLSCTALTLAYGYYIDLKSR